MQAVQKNKQWARFSKWVIACQLFTHLIIAGLEVTVINTC